MKNDQCCTHDCNQGRSCPRRQERRIGPATLWRRFWQLMREKRSGFDRRARVDMGGLAALDSTSSEKDAQECTCPSGAGSLRWPCPQHPPTADEVRNQALEEAAQACLRATPDRAKVNALGESGHYSTCAAVIRALKRPTTSEASNG